MNRKQYTHGRHKGLLKKALALFAVVLILSGFCVHFTASADADAVNEVKKSIMVVQYSYNSPKNGKIVLFRGTGFLINENHLLTCWHTFDKNTFTNVTGLEDLFDPEDLYYFDGGWYVDIEGLVKFYEGKNYNKKYFVREAVVSGDVTIELDVRKESQDSDFSILKLKEPINASVKVPAALGDSDEGPDKTFTTQEVYALGFPGTVSQVQNNNTYTSADVTVTDGKISKVTSISFWDYVGNAAQTPVLQHGAKLTPGNSGGPLVNESGAVLGINRFVVTNGQIPENYSYSVSINQIKDILIALNIDFTDGTGTTPVVGDDDDDDDDDITTVAPEDPVVTEPAVDPTANKAELNARIGEAEGKVNDANSYTDSSLSNLNTALANAKAVADKDDADQTEVDASAIALKAAIDGLEVNTTFFTNTTIIIIAVVLVVLIAVILIIVVASKGKKQPQPAVAGGMPPQFTPPPQQPAPPQYAPPAAPQAPPTPPQAPYAPPAAPRPPMPPAPPVNDGAGETSLLNEGAGETSVLGGGAAGALVSTKNGQRVALNRSEFTIGKERRKVDFVIDNSSVSRAHAKIRVRGGEFFILDLGSTNGTYLNGAKLAPNQETKLNGGDKVKISDEEFEFQV